MNKKMSIALISILGAGMAGCAQYGARGCGDREVTVNHKAAYLSARPEVVRNICRGDKLVVKLVPPVDAGSARIAPGRENSKATWLSASNTDPERIVIVIDPTAEKGRTYKYSIEIDGVGLLDPRFTVAPR